MSEEIQDVKTEQEVPKEDNTNQLKLENEELKQKIQELAGVIEKSKEEREVFTKKVLEEKEDFKGLYEMEKKKAEELSLKQEAIKIEQERGLKTAQLASKLESFGVLPDYKEKLLKLANTEGIKIDNESGAVYGHEAEAERLHKEFGVMFGTNKQVTPKEINKEHPKSGKITLEEWQQLPKETRMKRIKDIDYFIK